MSKATETTALTTALSNLPAPAGAPEGASDGDTIINRWRIAQKMNRFDGTPGKWCSRMTGAEVDSLVITPLLYTKSRVLFEKDQFDKPPLCKSNDSVYPDINVEEPYSKQCGQYNGRTFEAMCDEAAWGKDDNGRTVKPRCALGYNLIALTPEGPAMLAFSGTGIKPIKGLITHSRSNGVLLPTPYALFNVSCTLGIKVVNGAKGTYYVPTFTEYTMHTEAEVVALAQQYLGFASYDMGAHFEAEAAADSEA